MTNKYSPASQVKFDTLCPELKQTFSLVLERWDHTIFYGFRGRADQEKALAEGRTTKPFGGSKHNILPSDACDAGPYYPEVPSGGIDWRTDGALIEAARLGNWTEFKTNQRLSVAWAGDVAGTLYALVAIGTTINAITITP